MAKFEIITQINNNAEVVFNLSRSIDLHIVSTAKTNEKAVAGVTKGLINLGETVTWQAKHLFKIRFFTSKITAFNFPHSFTDVMQSGDLKSFSHQHIFINNNGVTQMKDVIELEAPFGIIGKIAMVLFLKNYFKNLLVERNKIIKLYAENGDWKTILKT